MFPPKNRRTCGARYLDLLGVVAQGLIRTRMASAAYRHPDHTDACKDYIGVDPDEVEEIMERSGFDGMVTSNQSLQALVEAGRVEAENAVSASLKPNELAQALRGRS